MNTAATTFDMEHATVVEPVEAVRVREFRSRIAHLESLVRIDFGACVFDHERARCIATIKLIGAELVGTVCTRATAEDWKRREKAIERSTRLVSTHFEKSE